MYGHSCTDSIFNGLFSAYIVNIPKCYWHISSVMLILFHDYMRNLRGYLPVSVRHTLNIFLFLVWNNPYVQAFLGNILHPNIVSQPNRNLNTLFLHIHALFHDQYVFTLWETQGCGPAEWNEKQRQQKKKHDFFLQDWHLDHPPSIWWSRWTASLHCYGLFCIWSLTQVLKKLYWPQA